MRGKMFNNTEGTGNTLINDISGVAHDASKATINNYAEIVDISARIQSWSGGSGPQGYVGSQGVAGNTGYTGQMVQGTQGTTGTASSSQGSQGFQGSQGGSGSGTQGAQGIQGAQGTQGTSASLKYGFWLLGNGTNSFDATGWATSTATPISWIPYITPQPYSFPSNFSGLVKLTFTGAGGGGGNGNGSGSLTLYGRPTVANGGLSDYSSVGTGGATGVAVDLYGAWGGSTISNDFCGVGKGPTSVGGTIDGGGQTRVVLAGGGVPPGIPTDCPGGTFNVLATCDAPNMSTGLILDINNDYCFPPFALGSCGGWYMAMQGYPGGYTSAPNQMNPFQDISLQQNGGLGTSAGRGALDQGYVGASSLTYEAWRPDYGRGGMILLEWWAD